MKIRLEDHVKFDDARMAKIALATTTRCQLDLYCVAPGQSQRPHTHADQDKIYYVLEGAGRFSLAGKEERLPEGRGARRRSRCRARPRQRRHRAAARPGRGDAAAPARTPPEGASREGLDHDHLPRRPVLPRGGRGHGPAPAPPGRHRGFPAGADLLRHAALQFGLSPRRGPRGGAHREALRSMPSTWSCRPAPAPGWSRRSIRASSRTIRRSRPAAEALAKKTYELSQFLVDVLGVTSVDSAVQGQGRPTTTPAISCVGSASRGARGRCSGASRGASWSSCRARTSAAGSAAPSRSGCPRCRRPSSTRSSPTSRATGADCLVACDAGCLMQMGGGLSRRGSRVRAVHLAQVLSPRGARERRPAPDAVPGAGARRAQGRPSPGSARPSPPPSSSGSARRPSRASRRARRSATGRGPSRRRRSSSSTVTSSVSRTISSGSAATSTGRPPATRRATSSCASAGTRASGWPSRASRWPRRRSS